MGYYLVQVWESGGKTITVVVDARDEIEAKWKGLLLMYQKGFYMSKEDDASVYSVQYIEDSILNPSARSISDKQS